jgi:hypothetical protein
MNKLIKSIILASLIVFPGIVSATNTRLIAPFVQFQDDDGELLSGGKLYFYVTGSSVTAKTTYSDVARTTPNTNPYILDTYGRISADIFGTGSYRVRLFDSSDNFIQQFDPVDDTYSDILFGADSTYYIGSGAVRPQAIFTNYLYMDGHILFSSDATWSIGVVGYKPLYVYSENFIVSNDITFETDSVSYIGSDGSRPLAIFTDHFYIDGNITYATDVAWNLGSATEKPANIYSHNFIAYNDITFPNDSTSYIGTDSNRPLITYTDHLYLDGQVVFKTDSTNGIGTNDVRPAVIYTDSLAMDGNLTFKSDGVNTIGASAQAAGLIYTDQIILNDASTGITPGTNNTSLLGTGSYYFASTYANAVYYKAHAAFDTLDDLEEMKKFKAKRDKDGKMLKNKRGLGLVLVEDVPRAVTNFHDMSKIFMDEYGLEISQGELEDILDNGGVSKTHKVVKGKRRESEEITVDADYIKEKMFMCTNDVVALQAGAINQLNEKVEALLARIEKLEK